MPEITRHVQGAPSWVELVTTDDQAAMTFYSALFGWVDDPQEMGPEMYYHLQKLNGLEVAAIYQQGAEETGQGVPPHWRTYFTVDDIEQTVASATPAGATVIMGPMQVFDAGHAAVIQDPQGATFALWQANEHIGVRIKGETGALMWNELMTTDPASAIQFYSGLLGLGSSKMPGENDYTFLNAGGTDVAGVMKITEEMGPVPPNWSVYFGVDDVDGTAEKAVSLGATTVVPAMDIPNIGRFAGFQDPQGAVFLVFKPAG
jgi:uncharacterized protein